MSSGEAEKAAITVELERSEAAKSRAARTKRCNEAELRYRAFLKQTVHVDGARSGVRRGNYLYLALRALQDPEHRVHSRPRPWGFQRAFPEVGPVGAKGIEFNPYAPVRSGVVGIG